MRYVHDIVSTGIGRSRMVSSGLYVFFWLLAILTGGGMFVVFVVRRMI